MRLSEAIFLGSKLTKQAYGTLRGSSFIYRFGPDGSIIGGPEIENTTCALGSAIEACGVSIIANLEEKYPWTTVSGAKCPEDCVLDSRMTVLGIVIHLNDGHHWTREKIADWVASVEPKEDPAPVSDVSAKLADFAAVDK